jgi:hypothetical protein
MAVSIDADCPSVDILSDPGSAYRCDLYQAVLIDNNPGRVYLCFKFCRNMQRRLRASEPGHTDCASTSPADDVTFNPI